MTTEQHEAPRLGWSILMWLMAFASGVFVTAALSIVGDIRRDAREVAAFRQQLSGVDLAALETVKWQDLSQVDFPAFVTQHQILWAAMGQQAVKAVQQAQAQAQAQAQQQQQAQPPAVSKTP